MLNNRVLMGSMHTGVRPHIGKRVSGPLLLAARHDAVPLATGVPPRNPKIPGEDTPAVMSCIGAILGRQPVGRRVALISTARSCGAEVHLIGGAHEAGELDAKRAIDQARGSPPPCRNDEPGQRPGRLPKAGTVQACALAAARAICAALGSCLASASTPAGVITVTRAAQPKETARWRSLLVFMVRTFAVRGAVSMAEL